LKLAYAILGIFLTFSGYVVLFSMWVTLPGTLGVISLYAGIFFFIYGLLAPGGHARMDRIPDALMDIFLGKKFPAFLSILMFCGTALCVYEGFIYSHGLATYLFLLGAMIPFSIGCLLLYVAIKLAPL